jgi:hypothetical protein
MRSTTPKKALTQLNKTADKYASVFGNESATQFTVKLARIALAKTPTQSAEALDALLAEIANYTATETVTETVTTKSESKTYQFNAGDGMVWHDKSSDPDVERCTICARKLGKNPFYVEVHDGGDLVAFGEGIHDGGYMGCWAVGSECAKKFAPELIGTI